MDVYEMVLRQLVAGTRGSRFRAKVGGGGGSEGDYERRWGEGERTYTAVMITRLVVYTVFDRFAFNLNATQSSCTHAACIWWPLRC